MYVLASEGYDLPLLCMYHYVLKYCVNVSRPPSIMLEILPKMLLGISQKFPPITLRLFPIMLDYANSN